MKAPQGFRELKLETLNNGAVSELFDRELTEVMKNISDINTMPKEPRKITIEIEIVPTEERNIAAMKITAKSKLAPLKSLCTSLAFQEMPNGQLFPWENAVVQPSFHFESEDVTVIGDVKVKGIK